MYKFKNTRNPGGCCSLLSGFAALQTVNAEIEKAGAAYSVVEEIVEDSEFYSERFITDGVLPGLFQ